ncbi:DUF805 domain-containing protein [Furfurilactobacillus cerevisiae]|uniref:DUF805 domain-containing protein n=1 Tax=Furfurilactobacillus rossiae TaxID=231049 RepID=UPI003B980701
MRLIQTFLSFWRNYTNFRGRATRIEFWGWQFWQVIFMLLFLIPTTYSIRDFLSSIDANQNSLSFGLLVTVATSSLPLLLLLIGYAIIALIPSLALFVRRLHDANRSAGWLVLNVSVDIALLITYTVTRGLNADMALIFASATATLFTLLSIGFIYLLLLPSETKHNRFFPTSVTPPTATLSL